MMDPPYNGPKMEARRGSGSFVVEVPREVDVDEEARVYGSRWVPVETADGRTTFEEVPLTWEDLFDPQEGDHVPHGEEHHLVIWSTEGILRNLFRARGHDDVKVCDDMKMFWADPKVPRVSPDVAVVFGVRDVERLRESFDEKREGTRPCFVLEVTSNATARFDRADKPEIYRRAKVKECLLLDRLKSPWTLSGYRLDEKGRSRKIRPDKEGRYLAKTLDVHFSIGEDGKSLVLQDAKTGEVLAAPHEAREAAEQKAAEEAEAREAAEQKAAEEAEAREAAERKAAEEAEAREAAERKAAEEAEAREAAEAKVRELLAKLEQVGTA